MQFDFVFFVPLAAVALAVLYPLRDRALRFPNPMASSRIRRILLRRLAVVVMPLASLIAVLIPFQGLSNISKALILCAMILVPAIVVHQYLNIYFRNRRKVKREIQADSIYKPATKIRRKIAKSTRVIPSEKSLTLREKTQRNIELVEQMKQQD